MNHLELLQEAEYYLGNVEKATFSMIEQIKNEETDNIFHMLGLLSEGIEWLIAVFDMTKEIQVEKIELDEIKETISTLVEGMENKDWMLLADCLEYSLLDQVIEWKRVIRITLDRYHIAILESEKMEEIEE